MTFNKAFSISFIIKLLSVIIIQDTIFIISLWYLEIDIEHTAYIWLTVYPIILFSFFSILFLWLNTGSISKARRSKARLKNIDEFSFFKKFTVIYIIINIVNDLFLYGKLKSFLQGALAETEKKISILNSGRIAYRDQLSAQTKELFNKYETISLIVLIFVIFLHLAFSIFSARRFVKIYGSSFNGGKK